MADYICIRECYHRGCVYKKEDPAEFSKGEKVPRHFVTAKKFAEGKAGTSVPEQVDIKVPPLPNSELHYDKKNEMWNEDEVLTEKEKQDIVDEKSRLTIVKQRDQQDLPKPKPQEDSDTIDKLER